MLQLRSADLDIEKAKIALSRLIEGRLMVFLCLVLSNLQLFRYLILHRTYCLNKLIPAKSRA